MAGRAPAGKGLGPMFTPEAAQKARELARDAIDGADFGVQYAAEHELAQLIAEWTEHLGSAITLMQMARDAIDAGRDTSLSVRRRLIAWHTFEGTLRRYSRSAVVR